MPLKSTAGIKKIVDRSALALTGGGAGTSAVIALKTYNGTNYLTAVGGGGTTVATNINFIGNYEKWTVEDINGGTPNSGDQIRMKASTGQYLCADANSAGQYGGGGGPSGSSSLARPNRASGGAWETFTITKPGGGQITAGSVVSLKSYNNFYMSAINGGNVIGDGSVEVNRSAIGTWEGFTISFL